MNLRQQDVVKRGWRGWFHGLGVLVGATGSTLGLFMVLPLMESLTSTPAPDLALQSVDAVNVPPPPPPMEEEPEKEPEPEEKPPELEEKSEPLDLAQLELSLNPGAGGGQGSGVGPAMAKLGAVDGATESAGDSLFSLADLDQKPRVVYQAPPVVDAAMKKKAPATVHVLFVVDQSGRVVNPLVQKSTDQLFDRAALAAVKQWKFEPGKRKGQPVRFRMRVPITFPAG